MPHASYALEATDMAAHAPPARALLRSVVIGLTAFLTIVDLFATQAILPSLTKAYGVTPAAMGFAVNASTMGMAVAGLAVALFGQRIERRTGILVSLVVLAIPTALLASAPDLTTFTVLRIAQGLCMASAFTLTLAHLGERCSAADAGGAFAAYITGNVASNLVGRLIAAGVVDHFGLAPNFYFFALLNLAGAALVYLTISRAAPMPAAEPAAAQPLAAWRDHLRNPALRAGFGIGFCILFAFIGTFTYVNFVLVREPISLGMMQLGFGYLVFLPAIGTTLLAGRSRGSEGDRLCGARWRLPARDFLCWCCRAFPPSSPEWCSSASGRSSPRLPPPVSWHALPAATMRRPAASISPATLPAGSSEARCWARSSIGSGGMPA